MPLRPLCPDFLLLMIAGVFAAAGSSPAADRDGTADAEWPYQAEWDRLTDAHLDRALDRIALRHDADAQLVRFAVGATDWLGDCSGQVWARHGLVFQGDDPLMRCDPAKDAWARASTEALLDAPDIGPHHLFALLRANQDPSVKRRVIDALLAAEPLNPAVLAAQLGDPAWQPDDALLDARIEAVAEGRQGFDTHAARISQIMAEASSAIAADPELITLLLRVEEDGRGPESSVEPAPAEVLAEMAALMPIMPAIFSSTSNLLMSALSPVCDPHRGLSERRLRACAGLGRAMAEQPQAPIEQRLGARLWWQALQALGEDPEPARESMRQGLWQTEAFIDLLNRQQAEEAGGWSVAYSQAMRRGESEWDLQQRTLREAGVPLRPPEGYLPEAIKRNDPYR
ncbi:hypothetical protein [Pseudomarimonas salicorniae]|uniref:HEAT repeat domain-containing protein n=1 Tax=Pseudomarimonas salicorniae TaxID=2933270 RepID=A0ABT0GH43_9GAMM|nr:hypothetical protein [Lysobacter sp. CAU 1642]MCK7593672.1 hypothetical protein [Lysobacter sp. CAU 1642]